MVPFRMCLTPSKERLKAKTHPPGWIDICKMSSDCLTHHWRMAWPDPVRSSPVWVEKTIAAIIHWPWVAHASQTKHWQRNTWMTYSQWLTQVFPLFFPPTTRKRPNAPIKSKICLSEFALATRDKYQPFRVLTPAEVREIAYNSSSLKFAASGYTANPQDDFKKHEHVLQKNKKPKDKRKVPAMKFQRMRPESKIKRLKLNVVF